MDIWQQRRLNDLEPRPNDHRTPWQRDKARILHSAAFRRLQAKTQIMGVGQNDFYRTRLTHSLEAAQIGAALVAQLKLNTSDPSLLSLLPADSLMESICLAHDIGHPPFGHGGEAALNACMQDFGGFEGNGQTFRIVGKLEPYTALGGMDLGRRTLLGLLKYPILQPQTPTNKGPVSQSALATKPCKAIYIEDQDLLNWVLAPLSATDRQLFQQVESLDSAPYIKSRFKSLDASIMELADDIAYGVHDLEDAVVTGTVFRSQWQEELNLANLSGQDQVFLQQIGDKLFSREHYIRKDAIGALVNRLVTSIQWAVSLADAQEPLIHWNACLPKAELYILQLLKNFVYQFVILHPSLQQLEFRGQRIVKAVFEAFASDPQHLLPANTQARWQTLAEQGLGQRAICDYVSGMTDEYAERMFMRLYGHAI